MQVQLLVVLGQEIFTDGEGSVRLTSFANSFQTETSFFTKQLILMRPPVLMRF
jgi:hypothetical protein